MAIFYKTVPTKDMDNIKRDGLDPSKCGQVGGATSRARLVRKDTELDKNLTWVTQHKTSAVSYGPNLTQAVLLKIILVDGSHFVARGTAGHTTDKTIEPKDIFFRTKSGEPKYESILKYSQGLAKIYDDIGQEDSDTETDEWG